VADDRGILVIPSIPMTLLLLLAACASDPTSSDDDTVAWYGWVLDGPPTDESDVMTGGVFTAEDATGALLDEGSEPEAENPGWWKLSVPPQSDVVLRLSAEGMIPSVYRATTPSDTGYWLTGALFAYDEAVWLPFFEQFDGQGDVAIQPLGDDVCWLFGAPWDPAGWGKANLHVVDGAGQEATVLAWTSTSDGLIEAGPGDPVDFFLAFNLAPGLVSIKGSFPGPRDIQVDWPARGGEIVTAWFLALPGDAP